MSEANLNSVATQRHIFGTDGVRGIANVEPMTVETAMRLGRAVAHLFHRGSHRGKVVIGKDTRLSGYMFEQAIAAGICSMGADVLLCGPLPTPGIAFITSSMRADAGEPMRSTHHRHVLPAALRHVIPPPSQLRYVPPPHHVAKLPRRVELVAPAILGA